MRITYQTIFGNVMLHFSELFHTVAILVLKNNNRICNLSHMLWGINTGQLPQVAFTQQLDPSHLVQISCCHQRCRSGPPNPQRQVLRLRNEVLLQLGRMVTSLGLNTLGWCPQDPLPNMTSHLRLHLLKPACTIET